MAFSRRLSWSRLPSGCGSKTYGYPGIPPNIAIALALETKGSVQITAAGMPRFSREMASCILHDEQDPQSPVEVTTTSHLSANSSSSSSGHGLDALPLFLEITPLNS